MASLDQQHSSTLEKKKIKNVLKLKKERRHKNLTLTLLFYLDSFSEYLVKNIKILVDNSDKIVSFFCTGIKRIALFCSLLAFYLFCCYFAIRCRFGLHIDPRDMREVNYYVLESGKHSLWVALLALFFV